MKKFLIVLSGLIILSWLTGLFFAGSQYKPVMIFMKAGWLAFGFIWMPVFLFYAYDRKQRRKEKEESNYDDTQNNS